MIVRPALRAASIVLLFGLPALAQEEPPKFSLLRPGSIQELSNAVLTLMSFSVTPDATASSLSINSASTGDPGIVIGQLGAGFTVATGFPLYMEGFIGYNRYDPTFVASNGVDERKLPTKWNSLSGTVGLGWDFKLIPDLYFRPIVNVSLGHVESDLSLAGRFIQFRTDKDIDFLDNGRLNAYGIGGSAMLDYGRYRENYEYELELRYTYIRLQSFDSSDSVQGSTDAQTVSLWTRWRQPTGLVLFRRPLRYVLELANSTYVGDQRGSLGFNFLTSAGAGIEFDFSAYNSILTRLRFIGRYVFGEDVSGISGGISITFF
jgi:hypothetical protein